MKLIHFHLSANESITFSPFVFIPNEDKTLEHKKRKWKNVRNFFYFSFFHHSIRLRATYVLIKKSSKVIAGENINFLWIFEEKEEKRGKRLTRNCFNKGCVCVCSFVCLCTYNYSKDSSFFILIDWQWYSAMGKSALTYWPQNFLIIITEHNWVPEILQIELNRDYYLFSNNTIVHLQLLL